MEDSGWKLVSTQMLAQSRLAWVAVAPKAAGEIEISYGSMVEVTNDWIVEGCWDAPFAEGNFHKRANFFGSGIRLTKNSVVFCSSMAMVDRILYAEYPDRIVVSNSLVHLLSATGAELDIKHDYFAECHGMLEGSLVYPREFRVIHRELSHFCQVLSANLILDSDGLRQLPRSQVQEIQDFDQYLALVTTGLRAMKENALSDARKRPLAIYSTLSSGYDSTAVTCLAKDIGARTCFTTQPSNTKKGRQIEDGKRIADFLDLESVLLNPEDDAVSQDEVYFLAPTWDGSEVIFDSMSRYIESREYPALVLTGYHGDKIWDRATSGIYLGNDIFRGDTSGLNLSEIRLKAGFLNIAVPFMFARNAGDIVGIASQPDMLAWQTNNDYDRPIPRRIAESKGVPGSWFGQKKQAILSYHSTPINKELREDFMRFLKDKAGVRMWHFLLYEVCGTFDHYCVKILSKLMPHKDFKYFSWNTGRFIFRQELDLRLLMFIWACSYLSARTSTDLAVPNLQSHDT